MKIAILGWGSLIWDPRSLKITSKVWNKDGVDLPIEFARISQDGRLTLVILEKFKKVRTLWNLSSCETIEEAIMNLKEREGMSLRSQKVGYLNLKTECNNSQLSDELNHAIKKWAIKKQLDAVIWTDLDSNFIEKTQTPINEQNLNTYLESLEIDAKVKAFEYIMKTPEQVKTQFRDKLKN
jgi:hypothetical protein